MGSYALTVSDIIDDSLKLAGDFRSQGADGFRWTRSEVLGFLRDTYLELANNLDSLVEEDVIEVVAGTSIYNLPSNCIRLKRVQFDGRTGSILLPKNAKDVDVTGIAWGTGNPSWFFRDTLGKTQIGFIPKPNTSGETYPDQSNNIYVTYYRVPTDLEDETSTPDSGIQDYVYLGIKWGVASRMLRNVQNRSLKAKAGVLAGLWSERVSMASGERLSYGIEEGFVPG